MKEKADERQHYIHPDEKDGVKLDLVRCALGWLTKNPKAPIYILYDGELISKEAVANTKEEINKKAMDLMGGTLKNEFC